MPLPIDAVFFDFDGLILDTELPNIVAWRDVFAGHGLEFPDSLWIEMLGRSIETVSIHPADLVTQLTDRPVDRQELIDEHHRRRLDLIALERVLPGVRDRIDEVDALGLRKAVVSSSSRNWVESHLDAIGLAGRFEAVVCGYEGLAAKPDPALYRAALERLSLDKTRVLALEDSPNGISAAKAAGIWCVVVPTALTENLDVSHADLRITGLGETTVTEMLSRLPL